jgi:thiamine-monophosphate kinase
MIDESRLSTVAAEQRLLRDSKKRLSFALNGGDDYELIFTVAPAKAHNIPRRYRELALSAIGEITAGNHIALVGSDGKSSPLKSGGWDPFR